MSPRKPSENEAEYFARQEFKRLKAKALEQEAEMAEAESAKLKELHYMCCPKCGHSMVEIELKGIKVDKCVSCKGVYFDDGELEQLMGEQPDSTASFLKNVFKW